MTPNDRWALYVILLLVMATFSFSTPNPWWHDLGVIVGINFITSFIKNRLGR